MPDNRWLIYGAYGFTGDLIVAEALRRGHRPVLAGRSQSKLAALASQTGLEHVAVDLQDSAGLARAVSNCRLVMHAAGPYLHTAAPMVAACLQAGADYLDLTGEIPVLEANLAHDSDARRHGIAILPGAGFDVVPTDCLARYVANQVPGADELEIAFAAWGGISGGTLRSGLEQLTTGSMVRRQGRLVRVTGSGEARRLRFPGGERLVQPSTWGDIVTAYQSTGIPNIKVYRAVPSRLIPVLAVAVPVVATLVRARPLRHLLQALVHRLVRGPDEHARAAGGTEIWARASSRAGPAREAWLETPEAYKLTAQVAVRAVERLLEGQFVGALTPAQAFGPDFILEFEGVRRHDKLEMKK